MNQDHLDIKTPEYVSLQFQLAGLGSRAAAFIIDQLLLMIGNAIILVILFVVMKGLDSTPLFMLENTLPIAIAILLLFVLNWGYFFAFEFFSGGRTIGKKIVGIRVIQDNGHSITLLSSFIRNLMRIVDSLPASYFLGIIMIFFHPAHKRLGDLVAGTMVVHERKTKRNKKLSAMEREIQARGITVNDLVIDEWTLKSLGMKEWKLVKTYAQRFPQLSLEDRREFTKKIVEILSGKIKLETEEKSEEELENMILSLYLILKEEWEFEM